MLGNHLLPLPWRDSEGTKTLFRAETLEWIRTLKLKGTYTITLRSQESSDRELLPVLPKMDSWSVRTGEDSEEPAVIGTLQHIRSGVSTFRDVLEVYGTSAEADSRFGVIISYIIEKKDGKYITRLLRGDVDNTHEGFAIAFGFDEELLAVTHINISTLKRALYPHDN